MTSGEGDTPIGAEAVSPNEEWRTDNLPTFEYLPATHIVSIHVSGAPVHYTATGKHPIEVTAIDVWYDIVSDTRAVCGISVFLHGSAPGVTLTKRPRPRQLHIYNWMNWPAWVCEVVRTHFPTCASEKATRQRDSVLNADICALLGF